MEKAEAEYSEVILASKSWAVGGTGVRSGEDTDNAKYYSKQSSTSADKANTSELNAANSEKLAEGHMNNSLAYSQNALSYMNNAQTYMDNAKASENNALASEKNAKTSEANAKTSETNAQTYMNNASQSAMNAKTSENNSKTSETNAQTYMDNAKSSENNALNSAKSAQSYAVGGTGTRTNEDKDNAYYYFEMVKTVADGLNSGFIPMGTISFSELATAEKATGFTYNISDNFVTDDTFAEGAGKSYTAGTNVYCRSDGLWDCFGGTASPVATVDEIKEFLGI